MKTALIAPAASPQTRALVLALEKQGQTDIPVFVPSLKHPDSISMTGSEIVWNNRSLLEMDQFFIQGFSYQDPVIPDQSAQDFSLWRYEYLVTQQNYSFLSSILHELERHGKKLINPFGAHLAAFTKPLLFERLRREGFAVPDTLTTNRAEDAQTFLDSHNAVVWRPATGKAVIQLFKEKQLKALMQPAKPAVILQAAVPGPFVRAFLWEGEPWLLLQNKAPENEWEETLETFWDFSCPEIESELKRLAGYLKAPWLQVAFVLNEGRPCIFDLDADPMYMDLPKVYAEHITARLAAQLSGSKDSFPASGAISPNEVQTRPTMFLRRMLDVLFDFERSKYP